MENCLPEDIIKCNFFRLSLSSQIKIYEMYLNDLKGTRYYDFFKKLFKKYIVIVKKFDSFKSDYFSYTNDHKADLRYLISKCRYRINPNNNIAVDSYSNKYQSDVVELSNSFVDKYIYDSFSYDKFKRRRIVLEFIACYSDIYKYDFEKLLHLFSFNRDMFNNEIRNLDSNFYSLYLCMDTVDRMKYIWYLSNRNYSLSLDDVISDFKCDNNFVKPIQKVKFDSNKLSILSQYFKMDC